MNTRIQELAEQAVLQANEVFDQKGKDYPGIVMEKLAELIVGHVTECVRDVLRDENSELSYVAATQVQNRIKEFFGVEE